MGQGPPCGRESVGSDGAGSLREVRAETERAGRKAVRR